MARVTRHKQGADDTSSLPAPYFSPLSLSSGVFISPYFHPFALLFFLLCFQSVTQNRRSTFFVCFSFTFFGHPAAYEAPRPVNQIPAAVVTWKAESLTHCAGLGIEPASRHSQDTTGAIVPTVGNPEDPCFEGLFLPGTFCPVRSHAGLYRHFASLLRSELHGGKGIRNFIL